MLLSLALIFLCGTALGELCGKLRLPRLVGMVAAGILIGPYGLCLLDPSVLSLSADLRRMALIIILTRAGVSLDLADLRRVGRPAVLMCFVPACCEIGGMLLLAPPLLHLSLPEAAVLGAVIAAVSPAVVVPKMLRLMDEGLGVKKGVPQLILAGASVDDVFVIVLFACFTGLLAGGGFDAAGLLRIPTSLLLGAAAGWLCGEPIARFFGKTGWNPTMKALLLLSVSFLLVSAEDVIPAHSAVGFSGLIAVMCMALALHRRSAEEAAQIAGQYARLWNGAETVLFVLVGAAVNIGYARRAGLAMLLLIAGVLVFRMGGVWLCLVRTGLSMRERLFCMIAYTPKATVQAAIGAVPLSMGLACGETVLTAAVIAILFTAPLGAIGMELTAPKLLKK